MEAMIALSRERALHSGQSAEIELTPDDEQALEQLGYGGDGGD